MDKILTNSDPLNEIKTKPKDGTNLKISFKIFHNRFNKRTKTKEVQHTFLADLFAIIARLTKANLIAMATRSS